MPEIDKTAGAGGNGEAGNSDDQGQNGAGENKGDQNSNGAGNGDENKDDKGDGSSDDAGDDKGGDDDGDDEEPEVRVRKTPKDFIIERQARKIEKLKKGTQGDDKDDKGDENNDDSDDDDVDPEDEKLIKKVASKLIAPIYQKQAEAEDEQEVKDFVAKNQDFAKYEKKVLARMKHPSRAQMPIKSIFYEVAGDDLLKIGADRAKKAEDEASRGNAGGGSARGDDDGGKVDYSAMPAEEFEKEREKIRQKAR